MSSYTPEAGDTPPHSTDPNATRYLPPRQTYNTGNTGGPAGGWPGAAPSGSQAPIPEPEQWQKQGPGQGQGQGPAGAYHNPYAGQAYATPTPPTPPAYGPRTMNGAGVNRRYRERTILGLILIGGGLLFLLQQFAIFHNTGDLIPLLIGGLFMYAYFNTRAAYRIGFLIPGAILLGIGVGEVLKSLIFLNLTALTLGLGFCLIWLLERRHWWALIPGGILIVSGISEVWIFGVLWPLALIALGVYLLYDQSRRRHNGH